MAKPTPIKTNKEQLLEYIQKRNLPHVLEQLANQYLSSLFDNCLLPQVIEHDGRPALRLVWQVGNSHLGIEVTLGMLEIVLFNLVNSEKRHELALHDEFAYRIPFSVSSLLVDLE